MDVSKPYDISICMYKINTECVKPFLEFLLDTSSEKASLPRITKFQCASMTHSPTIPQNRRQNIFTEETQDSTQEHTLFMNECLNEFLNIIPIHDFINPDLLKQIYKGFIEYDQDNIVVFFDCTYIDNIDFTILHPLSENKKEKGILQYLTPSQSKEKYIWSILYEILYNTKILDQDIDDFIFQLFTKHPYLKYIQKRNGNNIDLPFVLYLCEKPEEIYYNIREKDPMNSVSLVHDTIEHSWFGDSSIFSAYSLDDNYKDLKRFAVFIENTRYILKDDITNISEEEKKLYIQEFQEDLDVLSVYFHENNIQLWCIKSTEIFTEI